MFADQVWGIYLWSFRKTLINANFLDDVDLLHTYFLQDDRACWMEAIKPGSSAFFRSLASSDSDYETVSFPNQDGIRKYCMCSYFMLCIFFV